MASINALTDFKNRYAGVKTHDDTLTEEATKRLTDAYQKAYNAIIVELGKARKDVSYVTYAKQSQLLKQIATELDVFKETSGEYLKEALLKISEFSAKTAIKDLELLGKGIVKAENWHVKYAKDYAAGMFQDNFAHIAAQTDRMSEAVKTLLRQEAAQVFRRASVEGLTRKKAYSLLKDEIASKIPDFVFTDKAGRKWQTTNYIEMLSRTVMKNAMQEAYINALVNEGQDLVKVSRHQLPEGASGAAIEAAMTKSAKVGTRAKGAKKGGRYVDACAKWEGKVLSLTGATKGFPTLSEARSTGEIFHPRCRHRLLAYDQDAEDVFAMAAKGMSAEEILAAMGAAMPKPKEGIEAAVSGHIDYKSMVKIGPQKGSNPGGLFQDPTTKAKFYIKEAQTPEHAMNELLASRLYAEAGVATPKLHIVDMGDGKYGVASEWLEGLNTFGAPPATKGKKVLQKGFAVDAWLANWDATGTGWDNIGHMHGDPAQVYRIDVGGSLLFRAMGGEKGAAFGTKVAEIATLRDETQNRYAAAVYKDIPYTVLMASMKTVEGVSNDRIKEIIRQSGFTGDKAASLFKVLEARKADIKRQRLTMAAEARKAAKASKDTGTPLDDDLSGHWAYQGYTAEDASIFDDAFGWGVYSNHLKSAMQVIKGLKREEAVAILSYTNGGYTDLNEALRRNEGQEPNDKYSSFAKVLTSALQKLSKHKETTISGQLAKSEAWASPQYEGTLSRKITLKGADKERFLERWKVGAENKTLDFWSTSVDHGVWDGNIHLIIKAKPNHNYVNAYSTHTSEKECILPIATRLKVLRISKGKDRLGKECDLIELEEV